MRSDWTPFSVAIPQNGKKLLIKIADGRELKGERWHVELLFDDVFSDKIAGSHWDLQIQATQWKYL